MDARLEIAMAAMGHYSCEDCWYSCPLSEDGSCNDDYAADECSCNLEARARNVLRALDAFAAKVVL